MELSNHYYVVTLDNEQKRIAVCNDVFDKFLKGDRPDKGILVTVTNKPKKGFICLRDVSMWTHTKHALIYKGFDPTYFYIKIEPVIE